MLSWSILDDLEVAAVGAEAGPDVLFKNSFDALKNLAGRRLGVGSC